MQGLTRTWSPQAVGAKRYDELPVILQRCLLFLAAHGLPFSIFLVRGQLQLSLSLSSSLQMLLSPACRHAAEQLCCCTLFCVARLRLVLTLHLLPQAYFPTIFRALGEPPAVCAYMEQYIPGLQFALWLDIAFRCGPQVVLSGSWSTPDLQLCRPVNRILVAQQLTTPQLCATVVSTALHWPVSYLCAPLLWSVVQRVV